MTAADSERTGRATMPTSLASSDDVANPVEGGITEDKGGGVSSDASDFCEGIVDGISGTGGGDEATDSHQRKRQR